MAASPLRPAVSAPSGARPSSVARSSKPFSRRGLERQPAALHHAQRLDRARVAARQRAVGAGDALAARALQRHVARRADERHARRRAQAVGGDLQVAARAARAEAHGQVHVAHEADGRRLVGAGLVAERLGHRVLVVEGQAVALEGGQRVQRHAHAQEQALGGGHARVERPAGGERQPADELRVAEAADADLQIRLEHEDRVAQAIGALLAVLLHELDEVGEAGPGQVLVDGRAHGLGRGRVARQVARGERRGGERRLVLGEEQRLGDGADAVAEAQPAARQAVEEELHERRRIGRAVGHDELDVDVRAQAHLLAAVAAERHQRPAVGQPHRRARVARVGLVERRQAQRLVDRLEHQRVDGVGVALAQLVARRGADGAEHGAAVQRRERSGHAPSLAWRFMAARSL
ncbi:MAG: hypothetical protein U1F43_36540 [Myxococcota bacterium]